MRSTILKSMIAIVALACSYAFTYPAGGDSYEIYIGEKKLVQHYVHNNSSMPSFALEREDAGKPIFVTYSHCGTIGKERAIVIRTSQGVQKKWKYPDAASAASLIGAGKAMKLSVNELMEIKKKNGKETLELVYYSKELPKGRMLARVE